MRLVAFAALLWLLSFRVASGADLQGFSFEYQITGDRSIAPFQVFDDGVSTFMQFRDLAKVPAIFVRDSKGSRVVTLEPQGIYLRVAEVAARFDLVDDRKTAAVVSTRKLAPTSARAPSPPTAQPVGSTESPSGLPTGASATRDDLKTQLEALRRTVDALGQRVNVTPMSSAPAGTSAAAVESGSAPATPAGKQSALVGIPPANSAASEMLVFEVEAGRRLSEAVRRFLSPRRMDLEWDTGGADFEIRYGFRVVAGSLEEVLFGVLSPFKLNAVVHKGNNVVAVTRAG